VGKKDQTPFVEKAQWNGRYRNFTRRGGRNGRGTILDVLLILDKENE
jgi:hypothetical protein